MYRSVGYNSTCGDDSCTFNVINGTLVTLICCIGLILNALVIYVVMVARVNGKQKYSIINLLFADLLLSIVGIQRGLGMISESLVPGHVMPLMPLMPGGMPLMPGGMPYVSESGIVSESGWCVAYAFSLNYTGFVNSVALLPIALERFIAIVYPFYHKTWLNARRCIVICLATWLPNTLFLVVELASYYSDRGLQIVYNSKYHRCVYTNFEKVLLVKDMVCFVIPLVLIIIAYVCILKVLITQKLRTARILTITTSIVVIGTLSWLPTILVLHGRITAEYSLSQIITITLWYISCVLDPLTYIFCYQNIRLYILNGFKRSRAMSDSQLTLYTVNIKDSRYQLKTGSKVSISDVYNVAKDSSSDIVNESARDVRLARLGTRLAAKAEYGSVITQMKNANPHYHMEVIM